VGHLAEAFTTSDESVSGALLNPFISKLLRGELDRFHESVDGMWDSPNLLHVAYNHVKLLSMRQNLASEPHQLMGPATRIITMLGSPQMPITPLNHHFAALALVTLLDLAEIQETKEDAWKGIQQLSDALEQRRGISTAEDNLGWDRAIKDLISRRKIDRLGGTSGPPDIPPGHGSLQHLAELAVGERSPKNTSAGAGAKQFGTDHLQAHGYLGSLLL
jgi:hypothetical protein